MQKLYTIFSEWRINSVSELNQVFFWFTKNVGSFRLQLVLRIDILLSVQRKMHFIVSIDILLNQLNLEIKLQMTGIVHFDQWQKKNDSYNLSFILSIHNNHVWRKRPNSEIVIKWKELISLNLQFVANLRKFRPIRFATIS